MTSNANSNFDTKEVATYFKLLETAEDVVIANFINGEFQEPVGGSYISSYNPAVGKVWAQVPDSDDRDVECAVIAAKAAFLSWSLQSMQERARLLHRLADLIDQFSNELSAIESRDQGKPVWLAKQMDLPRAALNFRVFARASENASTRSTYLTDASALNYVVRQPIGIAGLIVPWNLPLYLLTFKLAPALVCGNTVIAKASEMTSVTAWMLSKLIQIAGFPPGVINFVFGIGPKAGEAIIRHHSIPLISFTGSTPVGKRICEASAPMHKKLSLEMGGKNACIVFEDADLDKCIPTVVRSSFANQGEICLCTSRIFVRQQIFEEFLKRFTEETKKLNVGPPERDDSNLGALISSEHKDKIVRFLNLAREENARILCGEESIDLPDSHKNGYYLRPTIITGVADTSALMQDEIFGPVTCVVPWVDEEEVIARANLTKYGLIACIWSQNVNRIHRVAPKLQVGTVWCNCWLVRDLRMPFGGIKASGVGREGVEESIEFFTESKTICVKVD